MTMATRLIVEQIDVFSDIGGGDRSVLIDLFFDALFLQTAD